MTPVERQLREGLSEDQITQAKQDYQETKREPYVFSEEEKDKDISAVLHIWKVTKAKKMPELVREIPCMAPHL